MKDLPDTFTKIVTSIKLVGNKKVVHKKEHVKYYGQSAGTTACICKTADIEGFNRICNNGLLIQSMWCAELIRENLVFHNLVMHMKQRAKKSKDYLTNIL